MQSKFLFILLLTCFITVFGYQYPQFSQCSPLWGYDAMGNEVQCNSCGLKRPVFCDTLDGSLLTSLAMALNGRGTLVNGTAIGSPPDLDKVLADNFGYRCTNTSCTTIIPSVLQRLSSNLQYNGTEPVPTIDVLAQLLDSNAIVIAHVKSTKEYPQERFVLLVDWNAQYKWFTSNDPYYEYNPTSYSDITKVMIFQVVS